MLLPTQKLVFFSEAASLYKKYYDQNSKTKPEGFGSTYTLNGLEKLYQMDFLMGKILEYEDIIAEKIAGRNFIHKAYHEFHLERKIPRSNLMPTYNSLEYDRQYLQMNFEIKLYCQSFYYIAFRLRNIIRYSFGLGKKFECLGVVKVRNLLIEHPENGGNDFNNSFNSGGSRGPVLEPYRKIEHTPSFYDAGLFNNAKEFNDNLIKILNTYFERN